MNRLLPAPSSAQDLLAKRRRGRRLEPIYQQPLSAPAGTLPVFSLEVVKI